MQRNTVLTQILNDFTNSQPETASECVTAFCAFADTWLSSRGIIGVGQTAQGLSLRCADGGELLFFTSLDAEPVLAQASVNITGNTGNQITRPIIGDSRSVAITGN